LKCLIDEIEFEESEKDFQKRKAVLNGEKRLDELAGIADPKSKPHLERETHGILVDFRLGKAGNSSLYDVLGGADGKQVIASGVARLWTFVHGEPPGKTNKKATEACDLIWELANFVDQPSWERRLALASSGPEGHLHAHMIVAEALKEAADHFFFPGSAPGDLDTQELGTNNSPRT
jgi:hypothetical protein